MATAFDPPRFDRARPAHEVGDLDAALSFLTDLVVNISRDGSKIAFGETVPR